MLERVGAGSSVKAAYGCGLPHEVGWRCFEEDGARGASVQGESAPSIVVRSCTDYIVKALEALKEGIVDHLGGLEETLAFVDEFQLVEKAQPGLSGTSVYSQLKREMWRETVDMLEDWTGEQLREARVLEQAEKQRKLSLKNVTAWETVKAKL